MGVQRVLFALLLAALPRAATAEPPPPLEPGARVRLWTVTESGIKSLTGSLVSRDEAAVTLDIDGQSRVVPRDAIAEVEVSGGKRSRATGLLWGAILGAAIGGGIGLATQEDDESGQILAMSAEGKAAILAVVGAPIGGLLGALIPPGERWRDVPLSQVGLNLGLEPAGGLRVSLSLKF